MVDAAGLLAAYDRQLRADAETPSAVSSVRLGPLHLVTLPGGRGLVTYRHLGDAQDGEHAGSPPIRALVAAALAHYEGDPQIRRVEWKTRGHDHAPGLHEALIDNGFVRQEAESIMLGEAQVLAVDVAVPEGVGLRRVTDEADVRAMYAMADEVFGDPIAEEMGPAVLRRLSRRDGMELWVAEAAGQVVGAGRLEPVAGTEFAGIWGGATRDQWRGQGIYRALTAARARSALRMGKTLIHSDSTEYSRPILERAGLIKVSTTTPYIWKR